MQGYWPTDTSEKELFAALADALFDDGYIIQNLNNYPKLVDYVDNKGNTLLIMAARNGCSEGVFDYLLERTHGIDKENIEMLLHARHCASFIKKLRNSDK